MSLSWPKYSQSGRKPYRGGRWRSWQSWWWRKPSF